MKNTWKVTHQSRLLQWLLSERHRIIKNQRICPTVCHQCSEWCHCARMRLYTLESEHSTLGLN